MYTCLFQDNQWKWSPHFTWQSYKLFFFSKLAQERKNNAGSGEELKISIQYNKNPSKHSWEFDTDGRLAQSDQRGSDFNPSHCKQKQTQNPKTVNVMQHRGYYPNSCSVTNLLSNFLKVITSLGFSFFFCKLISLACIS